MADNNVVHRAGITLPKGTEGALIKLWVQQDCVTIGPSESNDGHRVNCDLTIGFAVSAGSDAHLATFRTHFLADGRSSLSTREVAESLRERVKSRVRYFIAQQDAKTFYYGSLLRQLTALDELCREELRGWKDLVGVTAFLADVRFESPEYEEAHEEARKRTQDIRRKELEAEYRERMRELNVKDQKGQALSEHEVRQFLVGVQHQGLREGLVQLIDLEELRNQYKRLLEERPGRTSALREAVELHRPLRTSGAGGTTHLWALFAACLLVAAAAAAVLGVSSVRDSASRLERMIGLLPRGSEQIVQPASQPESPVAKVAVYRYVGKKPYGREIPGTLEITTKAFSFLSNQQGDSAPYDFHVAEDSVSAVNWHGEREPIVVTGAAGVEYAIILDPVVPAGDVATNMQLYKLLSDLVREGNGRRDR